MAIKVHIKLNWSWFLRPHAISFSSEPTRWWCEFRHREGIKRALEGCDPISGDTEFPCQSQLQDQAYLGLQNWAQVT